MNKFFFLLMLITMLLGGFAIAGMVVRNIHHPIFSNIKNPVLFIVDLPKELYREFVIGLETVSPIIPVSSRGKPLDLSLLTDNLIYQHQGKVFRNGKEIKNVPIKNGSRFINNDLTFLLSIDDGKLVKYKLGEKTETVLWSTPAKHIHHEIHVDKEGYLYAPTYFPNNGENGMISKATEKLQNILATDNSPPYGTTGDNFRDDGVLVISPEGKVVHLLSLTKLFEKNKMLHLIYASGLETDPFHLNSVYPAKINNGKIKKGDLLLSLRHLSMLLIYRPSTLEVIWYQIGPWLNQHSAKFDNEGKIYLFNNNVIETHYARRRETGFIDGQNEILVHNIESGKTTKLDNCVENSDLWTVSGGEVFIGKKSMYLRFDNSLTRVFCDIETMQKTYMVPEHDKRGKAIAGTDYRILNLGF